ncbi:MULTISPECIES: regulatory protein RecX [unclassified Halomonas]|uniref:regulatory protein RecX n=1 Tax=unclassified Halomonas TaxID=2609666 RepID=UPI001C9738A8|nr:MULTISPECIES: regulatory protein RecX [unclassified Halomonas]MBY5923720.1 recombination regulator RecX [Halomonas sp. DP4Y7-2]MBY6230762.1 recombination regulator RecX [Halomonas sp. DP4Y7-1]
MRKARTEMSPREQAVELLARREYGRQELATRLLSRGHEHDEVEALLDELAEQGLQSDRRFAESFLRGRVLRGQGPVKMLAELGQRGVDRELARDALREIEQEESVDWYQLATEALERRFGRGPASDPKERARRERFLAGRGFDFDHVREALRAMSQADT